MLARNVGAFIRLPPVEVFCACPARYGRDYTSARGRSTIFAPDLAETHKKWSGRIRALYFYSGRAVCGGCVLSMSRKPLLELGLSIGFSGRPGECESTLGRCDGFFGA